MIASALLVFFAVQLGPQAALSPSPQPEASAEEPGAATYSTRWDHGLRFEVGATTRHEVWIGLRPELDLAAKGPKEPCLIVIVANPGGEAVTFDPGSLRVSAHSERRDRPLRVLSADKVEKMARSRNARNAARSGWSSSQGSIPPPRAVLGNTSPTGGTSWVAPAPMYSSGIDFGSSYRGSNAATPDKSAAEPVAAMGKGLPSTMAAIASTLMRPRTLDPGTFYGGLVFVSKSSASVIRVEATIGDDEFRFELPLEQ